MSAQVAADLRVAAEVLRRDGWTQGEYEKPDGCKCVRGAIYTVAGGIDTPDRPRANAAYLALWAAIDDAPITWNDAPGRTADEVIAALEAAADAADRAVSEQ